MVIIKEPILIMEAVLVTILVILSLFIVAFAVEKFREYLNEKAPMWFVWSFTIFMAVVVVALVYKMVVAAILND